MRPDFRLFAFGLALAFDMARVWAGPSISGFNPVYGPAGGVNPININGSGFKASTSLTVKFNGTAATSPYADTDTHLSCYVASSTPLGSAPIFVQVGTASTLSSSNFTVIGLAPYVTDFSPNTGSAGTQVTFHGANLASANALFNGVVGTFVSAASGVLVSAAPTSVTTGPIVLTNASGRFTNTSLFYVPPVIRGFSPASGRSGTNLVVTGTNFLDATTVYFAGTNGTFTLSAAPTVLSNGALTVAVPTNAVTGAIRVAAPAGQAQTSRNFTILPIIYGFSPTNGNTGTNVVVAGANFTAINLKVFFNGVQASSVSSVGFGSLTATVPSGTATGPISVTTVDGGFTNASLFYLPPVVTSFTPTNSTMGTTVKITGNNFTGATAVSFNGTSASSFVVSNTTTIGAVVPSAFATGPISVTGPAGTATSTASFYGLPAVSFFSPTHGLPGARIMLSGLNFLGATAVKFNGTTASYNVTNNATIGATVPTGALTGTITVAGPAGTNASSSSFTLDYTNDILVTMTDAPDPVPVGSNLVYTITVANNSAFTATNVLFTNTLPDLVKLSGASTTMGSLDTSANPILGSISSMSANASATVTLTVVPQSGGFITNTAAAGSAFTDPVPANNATNTVTTVLPRLRAFRTRTNTVVLGWPAPSTGFNLLQNTNLKTTNWFAVTNTPAAVHVTNAVTTNENQVILTPSATNRVYRLKYP